MTSKAAGLASRTSALVWWARGRRFDIALGHGSNDVTVAAKLLRVPSATMFDYEWATVQHNLNCRLAAAVVVPDASMATDARSLMCQQLSDVGFIGVTMLSKPSLPSDAVDPGLRVVAA